MKHLLTILGALMVADTLIIRSITNGNLGTYLPAILGLPLLVAGLFFEPLTAWFSSGFGAFVKWLIIAGYSLFTIFILALGSVIFAHGNKPMQQADVAIVLGCGVRGERVSLMLKKRLDKTLEYMRLYPDAYVIVSGGQGENEDIPEAEAMYRYLVAAGADGNRIIKEDASLSTYENFLNSARIIDERFGGASVAFITTRFHVFRAQLVARAQGIDAYGIGADGLWYLAPNDYMRECIALAVYAISGKI